MPGVNVCDTLDSHSASHQVSSFDPLQIASQTFAPVFSGAVKSSTGRSSRSNTLELANFLNDLLKKRTD